MQLPRPALLLESYSFSKVLEHKKWRVISRFVNVPLVPLLNYCAEQMCPQGENVLLRKYCVTQRIAVEAGLFAFWLSVCTMSESFKTPDLLPPSFDDVLKQDVHGRLRKDRAAVSASIRNVYINNVGLC